MSYTSHAFPQKERTVCETISVILPTYNVEKLISYTLESVFQQTLQPLEILVIDDGSTDGTLEVLKQYGSRIKLFTQKNSGVAAARNFLVKQAKGSLISLLDSDDIWHPWFLEHAVKAANQFPEAQAFFAGHVGFVGDKGHTWEMKPGRSELLTGPQLFQRLNRDPGAFECASCFTARTKAITDLGDQPFQVDSCEDFYCYSLLSLRHSMVYLHEPLLAYRIRPTSLSANRVTGLRARVNVYERLAPHFQERNGFPGFFASHRRYYAKYLLGDGQIAEGRKQLRQSLGTSLTPRSLVKSLGMLGMTYLPRTFQPKWPTTYRADGADSVVPALVSEPVDLET
jgi:GT2 family glycosyltransferase